MNQEPEQQEQDEVQLEPESALPAYPGLKREQIYMVEDGASLQYALTQLQSASILGFDTETKPVFQKGQKSDGPHLVQLATETQAFLFPLTTALQAEAIVVIRQLLEQPAIQKVGFGLVDDLRHLKSKFGIVTANVLDLARVMRESKQRDMGVKAAVAKYFGMQMSKSKKTSTSNWALSPLSEKQIFYAANDAHVALLVYLHWRELKTKALAA